MFNMRAGQKQVRRYSNSQALSATRAARVLDDWQSSWDEIVGVCGDSGLREGRMVHREETGFDVYALCTPDENEQCPVLAHEQHTPRLETDCFPGFELRSTHRHQANPTGASTICSFVHVHETLLQDDEPVGSQPGLRLLHLPCRWRAQRPTNMPSRTVHRMHACKGRGIVAMGEMG